MIGIKLLQNSELTIADNVELARHAEAAGLDSAWTYEYQADAVIPMAAYAAATERISIGSSIIPLYTRSAPVLAMTAANLEEIAPGRIILGVGTSTEVIVERWHGRERVRPLRAAAEHLQVLRQILAGGRVDFEGEVVSVEGFQLEVDRLAAPGARIYAAALGEKMLRTVARLADGALMNMTPFGHLPAIREFVGRSAAEAGRQPGSVSLAGDIRVAIATGPEATEIRERQRREVAYYGKVPPYNRFFGEAGFADRAAAMRDAWEARDRDRAVAAVDDEMLDDIILVGDEDHVRQGLARALKRGMDHAIIYPLWADDENPAAAIRRIIDVAATVDQRSFAGA